MSRERGRLPNCTARVIRGARQGEVCARPAWWAVSTPYTQGFVCGNHRRAWRDSALFQLTPLEALP